MLSKEFIGKDMRRHQQEPLGNVLGIKLGHLFSPFSIILTWYKNHHFKRCLFAQLAIGLHGVLWGCMYPYVQSSSFPQSNKCRKKQHFGWES